MSNFGINTDRPNIGVGNQEPLSETELSNLNKTGELNTDNSLENVEYTIHNQKTDSPTKPTLPDPNVKLDENRLDSLSSHMPDTKQMTDLYNVMILFFQVAREGKISMREMNMTQAEGVLSLGLEAAKKMRAAAVMSLVGSIVSGVASIAGGMLSIGIGMRGLANTASTAANAGTAGGEAGVNPAAGPAPAPAPAPAANPNAGALASSNAQSALQISSGVGSTGKGVFDYLAQQDLAEQKEDEAYAAKGEAVRQQIKDDAGEMAKYMNAVIEALKEIKQNQEQSLKKIWS